MLSAAQADLFTGIAAVPPAVGAQRERKFEFTGSDCLGLGRDREAWL